MPLALFAIYRRDGIPARREYRHRVFGGKAFSSLTKAKMARLKICAVVFCVVRPAIMGYRAEKQRNMATSAFGNDAAYLHVGVCPGSTSHSILLSVTRRETRLRRGWPACARIERHVGDSLGAGFNVGIANEYR